MLESKLLWLSNRLSWHGQQLALVHACHRGKSTENLELKPDVGTAGSWEEITGLAVHELTRHCKVSLVGLRMEP